jgi:hypothetical protein
MGSRRITKRRSKVNKRRYKTRSRRTKASNRRSKVRSKRSKVSKRRTKVRSKRMTKKTIIDIPIIHSHKVFSIPIVHIIDNQQVTNKEICITINYNDKFTEEFQELFNYYWNKECFDSNMNFFDFSKDLSKLYISGKLSQKTNKTFKWGHNYYEVTCLFTVIKNNDNNKIINELWNVCTPIQSRKMGYLRKLFEYYLKMEGKNTETVLYVDINHPENIKIYERLGFIQNGMTEDKQSYILNYKNN